MLSIVCDFIDIFSTPTRDPRLNHKFNKNNIQNNFIQIIQHFLQQFDSDQPKKGLLLQNDKVQNILIYL